MDSEIPDRIFSGGGESVELIHDLVRLRNGIKKGYPGRTTEKNRCSDRRICRFFMRIAVLEISLVASDHAGSHGRCGSILPKTEPAYLQFAFAIDGKRNHIAALRNEIQTQLPDTLSRIQGKIPIPEISAFRPPAGPDENILIFKKLAHLPHCFLNVEKERKE